MDIFKGIGRIFKQSKPAGKTTDVRTHKPEAFYGTSGAWRPIFTQLYDGEKNLGEMGPVTFVVLDYQSLRYRSWHAYLTSEVAQFVLGKYAKWMIGGGLKLEADPEMVILKDEGIDFDKQAFCRKVEAIFAIFAKSKQADYSRKSTLNKIQKKAYLQAIIGGDVLVVLRYIDDQLRVQLIDGAHVQSPTFGNEYFSNVLKNGNRIINGIETTPEGEEVAYYVRNKLDIGDYSYEVIPAKGASSGLTVAFMVRGFEYRLDNNRGIPLISAVMETMKKLERYKEATVGSAEERQKISYFFEHQLGSTGENPMMQKMVRAIDLDRNTQDLPTDITGNELAAKVAVTVNKSVINLPVNSTVKSLESKQELHFAEFYTANIDMVCAAIGIPPDVALSKYNSNFSASRAALKDWEHTLNTGRKDFAADFNQHVYDFWLHVQILKSKIQAPGYLVAYYAKDESTLSAFRNARWIGANVPHIDPLKEVAAERAKLGGLGANLPLTTVEQATESLNGGESNANMEQYAKEILEAQRLGIQLEPLAPIIEPTKADSNQ